MNKLYKDIANIYSLTTVVDENNETTVNEVLLKTVYGKLSALTGNKVIRNDRNEIDANYVFNTDIADYSNNDTIVINNKKYIIKFIDNTLSNHLEIYLLKYSE